MFKHYFEGTGSSDIAQSSDVLSLHRKKLDDEELEEGSDCRSSRACRKAQDALETLQGFASTPRKLKIAIGEVLDLMDTEY